MLENYPLEHLSKHLLENHDPDWRFEYSFVGGKSYNCYLPTDSSETYILISFSDYRILETGKNVPQGLIDEIKLILKDGLQIYIGWEGTNLPQEWA